MRLGEEQTLQVVKRTDFGVYLTDPIKAEDKNRTSVDEVLLPRNQIKDELKVGDEVKVFIYKDSEDRLIATRITPLITRGEIAKLTVTAVTKVGAFMNWGLPKDLLLPFAEQTVKVKEGDEILVSMYIDNSDRLCATMKIYEFLRTDSPYKKNDTVKGTVYELNDRFGAYVAVDDMYSALIPARELVKKLHEGDEVEARVMDVKEDGKLDLSLRKQAYEQMGEDSEVIISKLEEAGGELPYYDKTDAETIKNVFNISKAAFKRAIGRLYKERKIEIGESGIKLIR